MKKKEIKIKAFSEDGSDKLFSFDKEEFDLLVAANGELAKMVSERDHKVAVLERALKNCCDRVIFLSEYYLYRKYDLYLDLDTVIDSYLRQAEAQLEVDEKCHEK